MQSQSFLAWPCFHQLQGHMFYSSPLQYMMTRTISFSSVRDTNACMWDGTKSTGSKGLQIYVSLGPEDPSSRELRNLIKSGGVPGFVPLTNCFKLLLLLTPRASSQQIPGESSVEVSLPPVFNSGSKNQSVKSNY